MIVKFATPVYTAPASRGKMKFWCGQVLVAASGEVFTRTETWMQTPDGEMQAHKFSEPYKVLGTNIGRANERGPFDQAVFEIEAEARKKMDEGYYEEGKGPRKDAYTLPMLANKYSDRGHHITFPAYVQPKYDGMRALTNGDEWWSRKGKALKEGVVSKFKIDLSGHPKIVALDGELMLPIEDGYTFQQGVSAAKKVGPLTTKLVYYVYDCIPKDPNMGYQDRYALLKAWFKDTLPKDVVITPTILVKDEAEVKVQHQRFVTLKYEGTMIRNINGKYKIKDRSNDLQKFKDFEDDEFEIVDVLEGEGKERGCAIFVCKTHNGLRFNARPEGEEGVRREYFANRKKLIGKMLSVRYQNLTDDGVPRFPVGVTIRDYE